MRKTLIPSNDVWVKALRGLYERGEISIEQYGVCLRRLSYSPELLGKKVEEKTLGEGLKL